jgi:hypothetical protein
MASWRRLRQSAGHFLLKRGYCLADMASEACFLKALDGNKAVDT